MKPLTAAIYARVSTDQQSNDMQLTEVRAYAARMGWEIVEYVEKGSSVKRRPEHERLMKDARERKIDVVICYKLDRFARSLRQLIDALFALDSYGVRFVCVTQGIDTDKNNPASRLMLHILGAVAEFERGLIVERTRSGVAEAQRKGKHCGRPVRIWSRGRALELRAQGFSLRAIAKRMQLPVSTIVDGIRGE